MKREPAVTVASITAAVTAVLVLLTAFGLPITDEQQSAILGVIAVVAALVVGIITRQQVTPAKLVAAKINKDDRMVAGRAAPQDQGAIVRVETVDQPYPGDAGTLG